ncbi:GH19329 [Drosophila grimshawi]|uniref:GH19329 n=1 Tax=Drosophila grimshawi TaxID=7222 RepID=B4JRX0_DROGR|nr:GH19329 [Drosophila grimshawi]
MNDLTLFGIGEADKNGMGRTLIIDGRSEEGHGQESQNQQKVKVDKYQKHEQLVDKVADDDDNAEKWGGINEELQPDSERCVVVRVTEMLMMSTTVAY